MRSLRTRVHLTASRLHKWLSLVIGVQVLVWMTSGLVMSALPIGIVRGEHLVNRKADAPITRAQGIRPLDDLIRVVPGGVQEVTFRMQQGHLTAEVKVANGIKRIDPFTGKVLAPVDKAQAVAIALKNWIGRRDPDARAIWENSASTEFRGPLPAWQVTLDDSTRVYISADSGRILAVRTDTWRIYDFLWGLHIMDWRSHDNFNNIWLVSFAASGVVFALAGIVLLVLRFPFKIRKRQM